MSDDPHVVLVVENLPVPFDRRVWLEAQALRDAGWRVTVICPTGKGFSARDEILDGIAILRHPLPTEGRGLVGFVREYATALAWELRLLTGVLLRDRVDVLHVTNPPDMLFWLMGLLRLAGVKIVYDQHDLVPGMYEAKYGRRDVVYRMLVLAERLTYRVAHQIIVTNEHARTTAMRRGGVSPSQVTIVGSAPDPADLTPVDATTVDPHLVGYVGIMGDQDGVDHLVAAADHLVHRMGRTDVRFRLIGDGPARPGLEARTRDLGLQRWVEFTGPLYGPPMLTALGEAAIGVDPEPRNGYSEFCTTNKVLEYMALGKAIVQYDRLEGRRSAGDAAVYARANDPDALAQEIAALVDDPRRAAAMAAYGRRRMVTELGWPHQRERLLEVYERLR